MRIFTYLSVAKRKQAKLRYDMAKIQIKSEKLSPFGGFFRVMEQFDSTLSSVIDSTSGMWQNKSYIPTPRATIILFSACKITQSPMQPICKDESEASSLEKLQKHHHDRRIRAEKLCAFKIYSYFCSQKQKGRDEC